MKKFDVKKLIKKMRDDHENDLPQKLNTWHAEFEELIDTVSQIHPDLLVCALLRHPGYEVKKN